MKRLSNRHRRLLLFRGRKRLRRAFIRRIGRFGGEKNSIDRDTYLDPNAFLSLGDIKSVHYTLGNMDFDAIGQCITPPSVFCLDENPDRALAFLSDFRDIRLSNRHLPNLSGKHARFGSKKRWIGTYVDIAAIRRITPAAALVLAAEYDRARRRHRLGRRGIIDANRWEPSVARTLIDVGFVQHLQADFPYVKNIASNTTSVRLLPMFTGNKNDPMAIGRLEQGLQNLLNMVLDTSFLHAIYTGLIEAMDNCAAHAYPRDHPFQYPTERDRWWMSGSVANAQELEVIFFDQGATIPGTLPRSGIGEAADHWLMQTFNLTGIDGTDDGRRIQAAMAVGRSAHRDQGRGHGLAQMRELVDRVESGSLRILSRRGRYIYEKHTGEAVSTLARSIGGTLVHWRFRL